MFKQNFAIVIILMCLMPGVRAQKTNTKILECDDFFKEVYENGKVKLFDLRIPEKYIKNRLVDAILADSKEKLNQYLKDMDKNDKIFLYCEIGKRTSQCSKWLNELGYYNVYQLKGGFINWKKSGFPVDSEKIKL